MFPTRMRASLNADVDHYEWSFLQFIFLFVLFVAEVSYTASTFKNPMYNEEMRVADFLDEPHVAVIKALLLKFQPTFLDILPLYIVLLLIFPVVLLGMQRYTAILLAASAALYAGVQLFGWSVASSANWRPSKAVTPLYGVLQTSIR